MAAEQKGNLPLLSKPWLNENNSLNTDWFGKTFALNRLEITENVNYIVYDENQTPRPWLEGNGSSLNKDWFIKNLGIVPEIKITQTIGDNGKKMTEYNMPLWALLVDVSHEICPFPIDSGLKIALNRGGRDEVLKTLRGLGYDIEHTS